MHKIDLHIHYKRRKRDQDTFADEMCRAAKEKGLSAIAFTEHDQHLPPSELNRLAGEHSICVYQAMEVQCYSHDLLVYGETMPDVTGGDNERAASIAILREAGTLAVILAHPFRKGKPIRPEIAELSPDGIEVASCNTPPWAIPAILEFAKVHGSGLYVNSDAHKERRVGGHWNYCRELPQSNQDLVDWIRRRRVA